MNDKSFMHIAIEAAAKGMNNSLGGPFGAIIVKNGEIIATGCNQVTSTNDPTAHAEVIAIRNACKKLSSFQLDDCILYTSCEPCPMCLGAIYWSRLSKVVYACDKTDAATIGFDDQFIYTEFEKEKQHRHIPFVQIERKAALKIFNNWQNKTDKTDY
jgi:tRNA(Arg) A34 adenosine deaminase TadA